MDDATILELQAAMAEGRLTSRELVERCLERIAADDRDGMALRALTSQNPRALEEADALDAERAATGPRGPLHGIPLIVKDNYDVAGLPTTAGSLAMADVVPPDDAFQVARLRAAGAVVLAKSNLHEFAFGWETVSSLGGQTLNPLDTTRVAGGSSGGTGAAVAAGFGVVGLGTDTCGSIRVPAALCGLVGVRATKGLTSIDGIVPMSTTQDVGGPLARRVVDAAVVLDATVGFDPADPVTALGVGRAPASYVDALVPGALRGARLGVLEDLFGDEPEDAAVNDVVRRALADVERRGATLVPLRVPGLVDLLAGTNLITDEFAPSLAAYLAATPGAPASLDDIIATGLVEPAVQRNLEACRDAATFGTDVHRQRVLARDEVRIRVLAAMAAADVEALAYPTVNRPPARVGERQRGTIPNTQLSPHTGLPAVTVPAADTVDDLPVGIELLGRPFEEARLLGLAADVERLVDERRRPADGPALEIVARGPMVVVGVAVEGSYEDLPAAMPAGWAVLRFRAHEITGRRSDGWVEVSTHLGGGLYREVLGVEVDPGAPTPGGMDRAELPAARYATGDHVGPLEEMAATFGRIQAAATARGEEPDGVLLDEGPPPGDDRPHRLSVRLR